MLPKRCGRDTARELARFMTISAGSASEVEYQLLLARDLNYIRDDTFIGLHELVSEVKMMLNGFLKKLRADL
jgi:four helix bundle protein